MGHGHTTGPPADVPAVLSLHPVGGDDGATGQDLRELMNGLINGLLIVIITMITIVINYSSNQL